MQEKLSQMLKACNAVIADVFDSFDQLPLVLDNELRSLRAHNSNLRVRHTQSQGNPQCGRVAIASNWPLLTHAQCTDRIGRREGYVKWAPACMRAVTLS